MAITKDESGRLIPIDSPQNELKSLIRETAIAILDDDYGVNGDAWVCLYSLLRANGDFDVINRVDATDGRFYLVQEV